jgi:hypothetical protein
MVGIETLSESVSPLKTIKRSIHPWVPSIYQGEIHVSICSNTFEFVVITEGLHKIFTMKFNLCQLTVLRNTRRLLCRLIITPLKLFIVYSANKPTAYQWHTNSNAKQQHEWGGWGGGLIIWNHACSGPIHTGGSKITRGGLTWPRCTIRKGPVTALTQHSASALGNEVCSHWRAPLLSNGLHVDV